MGTGTVLRMVTDWQKIHDREFELLQANWHVEETARDIGHTPTIQELMKHFCFNGHAKCFVEENRDDPSFQKVIEVPVENFYTNSTSSVAV